MGKNDEVKMIMRDILEVRFKNKSLNFMDYKGEFGDFIIQEKGWENIRLKAARVDIADKDFKNTVFFSWENFGLQTEAADNFEDFTNGVIDIFRIIKKFKKFKVGEISRIGTRCSIFYHKRGMNFETLKEKFKKMTFGDYSVFEKKLKSKIKDVGIYVVEMEDDDYSLKFSVGAMEKNESLEKAFAENRGLYENFQYQSGIFFDIDLYQEESNFKDDIEIEARIKKNIKEIENKLVEFVDYLFSLDKKEDE